MVFLYGSAVVNLTRDKAHCYSCHWWSINEYCYKCNATTTFCSFTTEGWNSYLTAWLSMNSEPMFCATKIIVIIHAWNLTIARKGEGSLSYDKLFEKIVPCNSNWDSTVTRKESGRKQRHDRQKSNSKRWCLALTVSRQGEVCQFMDFRYFWVLVATEGNFGRVFCSALDFFSCSVNV